MMVRVSSAGDAAVEMKAQTYALKASIGMVRTSDEVFQTLLDDVVGGRG